MMKAGDLVKFNPTLPVGTLSAVTYVARLSKMIQNTPGIVLEVYPSEPRSKRADGPNCKVAFGSKILTIRSRFLEVI